MKMRITEQSSLYDDLEKMSIEELTFNINKEDHKVADAIQKALPALNNLIEKIFQKIESGGRMFYVGSGSGGRLSVLDVIELPTTYGIERGVFNVILAGGVENLIRACEEMEDDREEGWKMLQENKLSNKDIVVGISASGSTPFVLAVLEKCKEKGIATGCIVSNPNSSIAEAADFPVEVITGPEFITGSTRMKCGSAQKMIFDMISTTVMTKLGRVEGNKMVNMKMLNDKMLDRSVRMLMENGHIKDYKKAKSILMEQGSVKKAEEYLLQRS